MPGVPASEWPDGGYRAIQEPPQRYRVMDVDAVAVRMGYSGVAQLQMEQRRWVVEALGSGLFGRRDPSWTESLAVGKESYVDRVANELGMKSYHKQKNEQEGVFMIRESQASYMPRFEPENAALSTYFGGKIGATL